MSPHQQQSRRIGERPPKQSEREFVSGGPTSAKAVQHTKFPLSKRVSSRKNNNNFPRKIMNRCRDCWWAALMSILGARIWIFPQLGKTRISKRLKIVLCFCADVASHDRSNSLNSLSLFLIKSLSLSSIRETQMQFKCKLHFEHKNTFRRLRLIDVLTWWQNRITPNSMRFAFQICVWLKSIGTFRDSWNSFAIPRLNTRHIDRISRESKYKKYENMHPILDIHGFLSCFAWHRFRFCIHDDVWHSQINAVEHFCEHKISHREQLSDSGLCLINSNSEEHKYHGFFGNQNDIIPDSVNFHERMRMYYKWNLKMNISMEQRTLINFNTNRCYDRMEIDLEEINFPLIFSFHSWNLWYGRKQTKRVESWQLNQNEI